MESAERSGSPVSPEVALGVRYDREVEGWRCDELERLGVMQEKDIWNGAKALFGISNKACRERLNWRAREWLIARLATPRSFTVKKLR